MFPPLFSTLFASAPVKALLGSAPLRVYPAGEATQDTPVPYAVFQTIVGVPENYLGQVPDSDSLTVQFDIYAATLSSALAVAAAVRDAIEPVSYIASWRGQDKDVTTRNYHVGFDIDFIVPRA